MIGLLAGLLTKEAVTGFLGSPLGKGLIIVVALFGWTVYQRNLADTKARAECQAAQIQANLDEVTRQRDAAWKVIEKADEERKQSEAEIENLEKQRDDAKKQVENSGDRCAIKSGTAKRLSNIK